jgi:hypothetical protein
MVRTKLGRILLDPRLARIRATGRIPTARRPRRETVEDATLTRTPRATRRKRREGAKSREIAETRKDKSDSKAEPAKTRARPGVGNLKAAIRSGLPTDKPVEADFAKVGRVGSGEAPTTGHRRARMRNELERRTRQEDRSPERDSESGQTGCGTSKSSLTILSSAARQRGYATECAARVRNSNAMRKSQTGLN